MCVCIYMYIYIYIYLAVYIILDTIKLIYNNDIYIIIFYQEKCIGKIINFYF